MKLALYLNTIKYLKFEQIFYQIYYRLITSIPKHNNYAIKIRTNKNRFEEITRKSSTLTNKNTFIFFGKTISLLNDGWTAKKHDKLLQYNLNYFDDLNAENFESRKEWHYSILDSWLNQNQYNQKNIAWEPYPVSIRSVNLIKWALFNNALTSKCHESLYYHGLYLEKRLERHILGNHLFSNAKALIFLGLYYQTFESDRWIEKGLKIIKKEIKEQILDDGGNFELSPSYHINFLEDILDLINILKTYDLPSHYSQNFIKKLELSSKKMIYWINTMVWNDGSLPSFNDSANNMSSSYKKIIEYADRLKIREINKRQFRNLSYEHLKDSGYLVIYQNNNKMIIDVGNIGPRYLTAHSHADTLSFEMEFNSQKLLVNSGTSCYGNSNRRHFERSTKAHNTVEVSNKNSSEVWSGFRVAKRAYPKNLNITYSNNLIDIKCSHNGYNSLFQKCIHTRNWTISENKIVIEDNISGKNTFAIARFIFHDKVRVIELKQNEYKLDLLSNTRNKLFVKKGNSKLVKWKCTDNMGSTKDTVCLEITLENNQSSVEII